MNRPGILQVPSKKGSVYEMIISDSCCSPWVAKPGSLILPTMLLWSGPVQGAGMNFLFYFWLQQQPQGWLWGSCKETSNADFDAVHKERDISLPRATRYTLLQGASVQPLWANKRFWTDTSHEYGGRVLPNSSSLLIGVTTDEVQTFNKFSLLMGQRRWAGPCLPCGLHSRPIGRT